jgi:Protein of unknown function (DUF2490)
MKKIFTSLALFFIVQIWLPEPVSAVENDFGQWNFTTINLPLGEKFFIQELLNTRVNDNMSDVALFFTRTGLAYRLNKHTSLWVGYDWFAIFNEPFTHENAVWAQVMVNHELAGNRIMHRLRQEYNFIPHDEDVPTLRYMLRLDRDMPLIKNEKFTFITWDEAFVNYNDNRGVPSGFAQNRYFIGGGYRVNQNLALELGYMLQHVINDEDRLNHWLLTNIIIDI